MTQQRTDARSEATRYAMMRLAMHERPDYQEECLRQLIKWNNGNSTHHSMTGECCPDFSCCFPMLYEKDPLRRAEEMRKAQVRAAQARKTFREKLVEFNRLED